MWRDNAMTIGAIVRCEVAIVQCFNDANDHEAIAIWRDTEMTRRLRDRAMK